MSATPTKKEIADLTKRKASLLAQISSLGKDHEVLENLIKNHEARKMIYEDATEQTVLAEAKLAELNGHIQKASEQHGVLKTQVQSQQVLIDKNNELLAEIEKNTKIVKVLQSEIVEFKSYFEAL